MAPSGAGQTLRPGSGRQNLLSFSLTAVAVLFILRMSPTQALEAKGKYEMDNPADCLHKGRLDVRRGSTTYVQGRSYSSGSKTELSCVLIFGVQTKGDTLKASFTRESYIGDPDVSLFIRINGVLKYSIGVNTIRFPDPISEVDGVFDFRLVRTNFQDTDYTFQIVVTAERSVAEEEPGGASTDDIGMIVGIVAGIIILLIILFIICICCRRRARNNDRERMKNEYLTKNSLPSNHSMGFENNSMKNGAVSYTDESPASNRKLLGKTDSADNVLKPKSALERFGPVPEKRQNTADYEDRDYDRRRNRSIDYEDREPERRRNKFLDYEDRRGNRSHDYEDQAPVRRTEEAPHPPRSPLLADLQKNPKFRRSFHETEVDARDRARRVSDNFDNNDSINSSGSVDSAGRPKLPPVPKSPPRSPSPQRRGEKIAGIFRARPSSSSSELAKQIDGSESEGAEGAMVPADRKPDTRHTLRPNRGGRREEEERKPRTEQRRRRDEEDSEEEERQRRRREKDRRDEERERRRRQEEEEEEEEEARQRKKEQEHKKRKEEERRRREEEEEEERRRRKKERDRDEDKEYEGRFKKSASGRRSKGKSPRMGRSRSTGNALEEMERDPQRSRSKSPSSVRSLNFIEDDEDDLDSNYMPFKRAGSKQSLYASRSSLYGRKRKNSMGETISLSSYAQDDLDSRYGDFDRKLSRRDMDRDRMFKSTGELEMSHASAIVVRECATQTGHDRAVYLYGKRTLARTRPHKMYSRGSQTGVGRERRDSTGSAKSGRSGRSTKSNQRLKHRTRSEESLGRNKRSKSRNYDDDNESVDSDRRSRRSRSKGLESSDDDDGGRRRRKQRSKSRGLDEDDDFGDDRRNKKSGSRSRDVDADSDRYSSKAKSKPKTRPRKLTGTASVDLSDSADDLESSMAASSVYPASQQAGYSAPYGPGAFPVGYPQPGVPYMPTAPGGPPMMVPVVAGGAVAHPRQQRPPVAPKPNKSKWETLVEITDGEKQRRRQQGDSPTETESVLSSVYSRPPNKGQGNYYSPPSYTSAQWLPDPNSTYSSAYPESSGLPRSGRGGDYRLGSYTPSESNL